MRKVFVILRFIAFAGALLLGTYALLNGVWLGMIPIALSGFILTWQKGEPFFRLESTYDVDLAERARLTGISEEVLRANDERGDREKEITIKLVKDFPLPSGSDEPIPPWIKYPGWGPYHAFWRMGDGESYLERPFVPFMTTLDKSEREQYFARYDLGPKWPHRDYWYRGCVDEDY